MKQAIICAICEKPKKASESYKIAIADFRLDKGIVDNKGVWYFPKKKVHVCKVCTKRMGYKVKKGITRLLLDNRLNKEL